MSRWPRGTLYPQKVGTNFADKRRSLGRQVRLRTEATELVNLSLPTQHAGKLLLIFTYTSPYISQENAISYKFHRFGTGQINQSVVSRLLTVCSWSYSPIYVCFPLVHACMPHIQIRARTSACTPASWFHSAVEACHVWERLDISLFSYNLLICTEMFQHLSLTGKTSETAGSSVCLQHQEQNGLRYSADLCGNRGARWSLRSLDSEAAMNTNIMTLE
jgi:hypothetical protein